MVPQDQLPDDLVSLMHSPMRGRSVRRRCVSAAGGSNKARPRFSSPDRFIPQRPESIDRESIFRVSRSPESLSPEEQRTRQRNLYADPFCTTNYSRSQSAVPVRQSSRNGRLALPHFSPSFVHGPNAATGPISREDLHGAPRQISIGAVWNVGGQGAAQGGPRPAIVGGRGGLLASGTHAPIHTAHFLDSNDRSQDAEQHQERLALALDIDLASRVLAVSSRADVPPAVAAGSAYPRALKWHNNQWTREEGIDRKFWWTCADPRDRTDSACPSLSKPEEHQLAQHGASAPLPSPGCSTTSR